MGKKNKPTQPKKPVTASGAKTGNETRPAYLREMKSINMNDLIDPIWEQQPGEPAIKYSYFLDYLKQPCTQRSISRVARMHAPEGGRKLHNMDHNLSRASSAFLWVARVAAYDAYTLRERQKMIENEQREVLIRHKKDSKRLSAVLMQPLIAFGERFKNKQINYEKTKDKDMTLLAINAAKAILDVYKFERLSYGENDQNVTVTSTNHNYNIDSADIKDKSDEELKEILLKCSIIRADKQ